MSGNVPFDDGNCFACGPENPIGLHLRFERAADAEGVVSRFTLAPQYQGWRGVAHGGIVMALLDEAMAHAAGYAGHRGMTAAVKVRFRRPVPLEAPIEVRGRVRWERRGVLGVEAAIYDSAATLLAQAEGSFVSRGRLDEANDRVSLLGSAD